MDGKHATDRVEVQDVIHKEMGEGESASVTDPVPTPKVSLKVVLNIFALSLGYIGTLFHLIGSGLLARAIVAVVGGGEQLVWITAVITFHSIVCVPAMCKGADYYGRKWFIVLPLIAGGVGCIIVSRANSIGVVIAGQAISGFAQCVQALTTAVAPEVVPRKYRGWALAALTGPSGVAAVIAILSCGAMTRNDPAGFRNYWYFVAAFYLISGVLITFCYNPPLREQQKLTFAEKMHGLDLPGCTIVGFALLGFALGLSWADNPYSWQNAHVLVPFIIGLVAATLMILYAIYVRRDGFLHQGLFSGSSNYAIVMGLLIVEGIVFICANNYSGFQLSAVYNTSSWETSEIYCITWLTFIVFAPLTGWFITKTRRAKLTVTVGFASFTLYFALMAATNLNTKNNIWGYNVFLGIGLAITILGMMVIAQLSTPPDLISPATGLMIATRVTGAVIGLVVFNAILNSALTSKLVPSITDAALSNGLPSSSLSALIGAVTSGNAAGAADVPGITDAILEAVNIAQRKVYIIGFRNGYATAAAFCSVACIGSLFLKDPMQEYTATIDAPLDVEFKQERSEA